MTSTSAILNIDTDGDATPDANLTPVGDFEGESLELISEDGATMVRIAGEIAHQASGAGERFITTNPGPDRVFGDDVAATGGGDDLITSGAGADVVIGGGGADILIGGLGPDILTSGSGADVFVFSDANFSGIAADFVTDVTPGEDVIELTGFGIAGLADLSFTTVTEGDRIALGSGRFIVPEGLTAGDLTPGDIVGTEHARDHALVSARPIHRLTDADDRFISTDTVGSGIFGRDGADAIVAGSGDDIIRGGGGSDVLIDGHGANVLIGGAGADRLSGLAGPDEVRFTAGEETDFVAGFITDYELRIDGLTLAGFVCPVPAISHLPPSPRATSQATDRHPFHRLRRPDRPECNQGRRGRLGLRMILWRPTAVSGQEMACRQDAPG